MLKGALATVIGALFCIGALVAWLHVAPAAGSGWILVIAFLGGLGLLNSIGDRTIHTVAGLAIAVAAGFTWFAGQNLPHSFWVGFLAVLAALGTFQSLNAAVAEKTSDKPRKRKSSDAKKD